MGDEPKKKINAYSLDVALSNKYLEIIIRCLELWLYNQKDQFFLVFFFLIE